MRNSFKFILCVISADVIIIAIVFLINLTGTFSSAPSNHSKVIKNHETDQTTILSENASHSDINPDTVKDSEDVTNADITFDETETDEQTTEEPTTLPENSFVVMNTTSKVYLRSEASTGGKIICEIPSNSYGSVISKEGSWTKVSYDGKTGYIFSEYILTGSSANDYVNELNSAKIKITSACNIRNIPELSSPVTGNTTTGTEYQYIKELSNDDWFAIILEDGSTAYISTGYATIIQ